MSAWWTQAYEQPEWRERADCLGTDPEAFFPADGERATPAKRICSGCEVRDECLADALEVEAAHPSHRYGVWGGLSPEERKALARALGAA
jgi:WhiB family transcriptional regulator, redox-sensing transcriptional regulator